MPPKRKTKPKPPRSHARKPAPPPPPPAPPKPPKIKLKRNLGAKITNEVILTTYRMLASRCYKSEIKHVLDSRFKLAPRSCERAIHEAREMLRDATAKSEDEHRNDAYKFYDSIVRDHARGIRFRILSQERIDKLLALDGPIKLQLPGGVGDRARLALALVQEAGAADLLEQLDDKLSAAQAKAAKQASGGKAA